MKYLAGDAAGMMAAPPMPQQQPPMQPMMPGPPLMAQPASRQSQMLVWGSVLRMVGAVIVGVALLWLGTAIANPLGLFNPFNPFAGFQTIGSIIMLAAVGGILINIGWSMQTWAVGLILSFERR